MKRKISLVILSLIIIILSFIGCSSKNNNPVVDSSNNNKTITVGTSGTYYPFTFLEGGELKGFEVDVWNEIGKRIRRMMLSLKQLLSADYLECLKVERLIQ